MSNPFSNVWSEAFVHSKLNKSLLVKISFSLSLIWLHHFCIFYWTLWSIINFETDNSYVAVSESNFNFLVEETEEAFIGISLLTFIKAASCKKLVILLRRSSMSFISCLRFVSFFFCWLSLEFCLYFYNQEQF